MEPSDLIFSTAVYDGEKFFVIVPRAHFREHGCLYDEELLDEVDGLGEIVGEEGDSVFTPHTDDFEEATEQLLELGLTESAELKAYIASEGDSDEDDEDPEDDEDEDF